MMRIVEAVGDTGTRFLARVILAGDSLNGNHYPEAVLREAAPLFNGVRVFDKSDEDHIKGRNKAANQIIGRLAEAKWNPTSKCIEAIFEALESAPVVKRISEALKKGWSDVFGLSIDAVAITKMVGKLREAVRFVRVDSVDLVADPGAGGALIRLVEAAPNSNANEETMRAKMIDMLVKKGGDAEKLAALSDDELMSQYTRLAEAAPATSPAPPAAAVPAPVAASGLSEQSVQRMIEAAAARGYARHAIGTAQLPEQAKAKLLKQLEREERLTEAAVDVAIKEEQTYLGHFVEAGKINLPRIESGKTQGEKSQARLDDFFAGKPGATSIREAYVQFTGDKDVTGRLSQCDLSRMAEATGTFREAVNSGTFANALGDSITRQMQKEYAANTLFQDWEYMCDVVDVRDFRTQERVQMGGYGNLPTVAQGANYAPLTTPSDVKATYAATKRGGTEEVTLEAIANDDVGLLRRIPTELSTAAGMTLYDFVYSFLLGNGLIYDGLALFAGGHNNTGVAPISNASFSAARLALMNQVKPGSLKRLNLILKHIVAPPELEEVLFDMFVRNTNNDETFTQSRKPTVHICPSATDTNNWYALADKSQIAQLEIGFYGSRNPEIFVQDNPTLGSMFAADKLTYKIRHIYGGTVKDYRGFYGALVP